MTPIYAGVDGGGTRTRVLMVDGDGTEVASLEGAAGAVRPGDPEAAAAIVARLVQEAAEGEGIGLPLSGLWAGLAGAGRREPRLRVEAELRRLQVARAITVGTDVQAALHDAFPSGPGILLLGGTGSIALARAPDGGLQRAGGWGPVLGDEGSGYRLGLAALRAVVRQADGRDPPTPLAEAVLHAARCATADELVPWVSRAGRGQVAALVPVVARRAAEGDPAARSIVADAVEALVALAATLRERLGPWPTQPPVALTGGLLDPGGALRSPVESVLRREGFLLRPGEVVPVRGAARLARALSSWPAPE